MPNGGRPVRGAGRAHVRAARWGEREPGSKLGCRLWAGKRPPWTRERPPASQGRETIASSPDVVRRREATDQRSGRAAEGRIGPYRAREAPWEKDRERNFGRESGLEAGLVRRRRGREGEFWREIGLTRPTSLRARMYIHRAAGHRGAAPSRSTQRELHKQKRLC